MSEAGQNAAPKIRRLAEAVREVKAAAADREDVVVDMRETTRARLELLAQELAPVFAEVPEDDPAFDLAISSGQQPRLWIDTVAMWSWGLIGAHTAFYATRDLGVSSLVNRPRLRPSLISSPATSPSEWWSGNATWTGKSLCFPGGEKGRQGRNRRRRGRREHGTVFSADSC